MGRKKGVIFSYILMFVEAISSIVFTPYLIKCLGQEEYGIYGLVASITAYLYLLDLGVGNAIIRYMAKFRFKKDRISEKNLLAITIIFYLLIGIVIISVGEIIKESIPQLFNVGLNSEQLRLTQNMMRITIFTTVATLLFSPFKKIVLAYEKFVFSKSLDIFKIAIRVLLSFIVLFLGGRAIEVLMINLIITILVGLINLSYVYVKLKLIPKLIKVEFKFVKEIVGYSFFIMIQMIATQINAMANHILIGAFVYSSAIILGVYTVGTQITTYFQSFGTAMNGVLMPGVVKMIEKQSSINVIEKEMIKVSRLIFMVLGLIWIGFLVCGKQFVLLWAGLENIEAYYVIIIIMTPMLFYLSEAIGTQILWAMNQHKIQAYLKIFVAIFNIFLTILLIKWNPLLGAAIGTGIAFLIGDVVVMNVVFKKNIGISLLNFYKGLFKGIVPCLILTTLCGFLFSLIDITGWLGLITNISFMCIIYVILMYFIGLNSSEKNILRGIPIIGKIIG